MDGENFPASGLHEAVLYALKSPLVAVDQHGAVVEWNRAAELCTGITRTEALGRAIWDLTARVAPAIIPYEDALYRFKDRFNSLVALTDAQQTDWTEEFDWEILSTKGEAHCYRAEAFPVMVDRDIVIVNILDNAQRAS